MRTGTIFFKHVLKAYINKLCSSALTRSN